MTFLKHLGQICSRRFGRYELLQNNLICQKKQKTRETTVKKEVLLGKWLTNTHM